MKNAMILCRISDLKQDDGYSLDAQEQYGRDYCEKHKFKIKEVFRFVETGSKSNKRHKFDRMMGQIQVYTESKKNSFPLRLVVEKPDRLTRNFTNREQLQGYVQKGLLEIHYYKDRRVFDQHCGPADVFTDDMMTSVSKYIALNIARETNKGMKQKAESGWFPGHAPLGYKNIRDGALNKHGRKEARIAIDETTKAAALRIFELRAYKGLSYESIRKTILEENLLPPKKAKRFQKSSVETILNNIFYTGYFDFKGEVYKGKHEALISHEMFKKAQGFRGVSITKRPKGVFSDLFRCGLKGCGCKVIYDPKTKINKTTKKEKKYEYYHCGDGKFIHRRNKIKQVNLSESKIWEAFEEGIKTFELDEEAADKIFEAISQENYKESFKAEIHKQDTKNELQKIKEKQSKLYEHFAEELIDEEFYKEKLKKLKAETLNVQNLNQGNKKEPKPEEILENSKALLELCKSLKYLWKKMNSEERLEVVKRCYSNFFIEGASVRYNLRKPFEVLKKSGEKGGNAKWCPRSQSTRTTFSCEL